MSGIHLLLLHPWVCSLCGSCLKPARPHASVCSRLIVAVLPAHGVTPSVEHCGMAVLPAFAITTFFIPSVALHVFKVMASALGACCQLGCSRHPDRDTSASSVSWGAALRLSLSSVRVMFSHHDIDHRDVRVHFAKRQLVQDLCFSGCLKPHPQDRHLGLANQSLPCSRCCVCPNT